jgi:KRAB domain-containing zinc finger protein
MKVHNCFISHSEFPYFAENLVRIYAVSYVHIVSKSKTVYFSGYKCNTCEYSTNHKNHYTSHLNRHAGLKAFSCNICGKAFTVKEDLQMHVKRVHMKIKATKYRCSECPYSTDMKTHFTNHRRTHTGEKPFKCNESESAFAVKHTLDRHMKSIHMQIKGSKYKCSECDYATDIKTHYTYHRRIHTKERPFKCEQCDSYFTQKSSLNTHIKFVHRKIKPFRCDQCVAAFVRKHELVSHTKFVHEGISSKYQCGVCDYGTDMKTNFTEHNRIHTGEKPFKCEQCQKTFSRKSHLARHKKTVHR